LIGTLVRRYTVAPRGHECGAAMTLNGKRIVIVEDEIIVAMDLADEIIASGGKVIEAVGSVDAALDIIATTDLDGTESRLTLI
jgi:hypothetical protein